MANYKLTTHTPASSSTSSLAFTAGATNTVVSSIIASDTSSGTILEVLVKKSAGSVIELSYKTSASANDPLEMLNAPLALEAGDELYVRTSRAGANFVISYVEETTVANDTALGGLVDVDTTGATDGQSLVYDSSASEWVPQTITGGTGGGASALDDLSDVAITGGTSGHILRSNGTNFVNVSPSTDLIPEGSTNLYYTDARVDARIAADTTKAAASHTHTHDEITDFDTATNALIAAHPDLGEDNVNADWNAVSGDAQILNKPALFSGSYTDLTNVPATFTPSAHTHTASEITDFSTAADARITNANLAAASHTHVAADITDFEAEVDSILAATYLYELDDVADYSSTAPTTGQVLKWNGTAWAPGTDNSSTGGSGGVVDSVNGISQAAVVLDADDIDDTSTAHKFVAQADLDKLGHISVTQAVDLDTMESTIATNTSGVTAAVGVASAASSSINSHTASIENHSDVSFAYTALNRPNNAFIVWDDVSGRWEDGTISVDKCSDVDTTTAAPSTGDVLEWDGSNWVPAAPSTGGGGTNTHDTDTTFTSTGDYDAGADIMDFTTAATTLAGGRVYALGSSGWTTATNAGSSANAMLAVCSSAATDGSSMILRGLVKVDTSLASANIGDPVYLHTGSKFTITAPTSAATVVIVGRVIDPASDVIFFDPDKTTLTLQ